MRIAVGLLEVTSVEKAGRITAEDARRAMPCANRSPTRPRSSRPTRGSRRSTSPRHTAPWTRQTLDLIDLKPTVRAPDLAGQVGRETADFKKDVRKLKELGLTESLDIGHRLSPRG